MAAAAGLGLGLIGNIGSTIANVQTADVNAKSLDAQARSEEAQAAFQETQQRRENQFYLGNAVAKTAASGVAITSGSPLLHELDRVKQTEIQALNIRYQGQNAANASRFQSRMVRRQIPWQILTGIAGAGSSLTQYAGNGGFRGGSGYGTASPTASSGLNNWYGGGGYGTGTAR